MDNVSGSEKGSGVSSSIAAQVALSNKKPLGMALLLTFLFGPLGMMYSTIVGGIIMLIISVPLAIVTLGIGLLVLWPILLGWTWFAIKSHNDKIDRMVLSA